MLFENKVISNPICNLIIIVWNHVVLSTPSRLSSTKVCRMKCRLEQCCQLLLIGIIYYLLISITITNPLHHIIIHRELEGRFFLLRLKVIAKKQKTNEHEFFKNAHNSYESIRLHYFSKLFSLYALCYNIIIINIYFLFFLIDYPLLSHLFCLVAYFCTVEIKQIMLEINSFWIKYITRHLLS